PQLLQLPPQGAGVLHDAVVHEGDVTALAHVRVCVPRRRRTVGGPAGVADAVDPRDRILIQQAGELGDLARLFPHLDVPVLDDGDTRRVVATVLETAKSLEEERRDLTLSDITDDPAHRAFLLGFVQAGGSAARNDSTSACASW